MEKFLKTNKFYLSKDVFVITLLIIYCFLDSRNELKSIIWVVVLWGICLVAYLHQLRFSEYNLVLKKFLIIIAYIGVFSSVVAYYQLITGDRLLPADLENKLNHDTFFIGSIVRVSAFSGNPNSLAYFIGASLYFVYFLKHKRWISKKFFVFYLLFIIPVFLLCYSRGAILIFAISFVLTNVNFREAPIRRICILISCLLLAAIFFYIIDNSIFREVTDYRIFGLLRFFLFC